MAAIWRKHDGKSLSDSENSILNFGDLTSNSVPRATIVHNDLALESTKTNTLSASNHVYLKQIVLSNWRQLVLLGGL